MIFDGLDPLGWLESFSFCMLLAILFCACCSFYCEQSPNRYHWDSGDVYCPNSNEIVADPTKATSECFGSSGAQQYMETRRGQHARY